MANVKKLMTLDELHWRMTEVLESLDGDFDPSKVKLQIQAGAVILNIHKQKENASVGAGFINKAADHLLEE